MAGAGAGAIVAVASSIARVTSHGGHRGKSKKGERREAAKDRFKWMGIRTGPSSFYRCSKIKFDLKAQGLSSPHFSLPSPPSLAFKSMRPIC